MEELDQNSEVLSKRDIDRHRLLVWDHKSKKGSHIEPPGMGRSSLPYPPGFINGPKIHFFSSNVTLPLEHESCGVPLPIETWLQFLILQ